MNTGLGRAHPVLRAQAAVIFAVLAVAALAGYSRSLLIPAALAGGAALVFTLRRPALGLALIPIAAIFVPLEIKVSTVVTINVAFGIVPLLLTLYALSALQRRSFDTIPGAIARPMALFIFSTSLSLLLGNVYWDPNVPRPDNVWWVQIGQWAVYVFSMAALWLGAVQLRSQKALQLVTFSYLIAGSVSAFLFILPFTSGAADSIVAWGSAFSPYWSWMTAMLTALLLFDRNLRPALRLFALVALAGVWYLALRDDMTTWLSGFVPMLVATAVLLTLRFPRRALVVWALALILVAVFSAPLVRAIVNSDEFRESAGGRYGHWSVVWEFARTRPIFGLGLAAYRHYSAIRPDLIKYFIFTNAGVSTHNNYYDIFAFMGVFGLAAFLWLVVALARLCLQVVRSLRGSADFDEAYAAGVTAGFAGMLASGMLGDWFLPFVYNVGFPGLRSSLIGWVLLGGLVALASRRKLK